MDRISFLAFTWEGKITENLQFSLSVLRVDRKGENKMVLIVLEENLGFREVIPLRKNWGWKMKGDPPACQQSCGAVPKDTAFPIPIKSRPSKELYQHTHRQDPQCHTWSGPVRAALLPPHGRRAVGEDPGSETKCWPEHTVGAAQEPLLTDCSNPDLHFLISPPF